MNSIEPPILLETEDIIVIDKPAGWLTHADGKTSAPTVVDWLLHRLPTVQGVGESAVDQAGNTLDRSGVVHRLDRETSGVLLLCKTSVAYDYYKRQFQSQHMQKEYRAVVYGKIKDRWGTINRPIGRHSKDARKRSADRGARGVLRDAVTDFECLQVGAFDGETFSYVSLRPQTGRTHQLRVHLRALDRPIVGDVLYGDYKLTQSNNLLADRMLLHAHTLSFSAMSGDVMVCTAPLPEGFTTAVGRLLGEE